MKKPLIMGIINVTPDSFHEGSRCLCTDSAIQKGIEFSNQGADILDIGGESSRPGAIAVTLEEELARVIPVIQGLRSKVSKRLSIDTRKPEVAKAALEAGADMINDIEGFSNPDMQACAVNSNAFVCIMHMQGTPETMQNDPQYSDGIISHLMHWFQKRTTQLMKVGVRKEKIILDPGIGFGKTVADNLEILHNLPKFKTLGYPLLVGTSRKSFLSKILNKPPSALLTATLSVNTMALQLGADILRVHDVAEHADVVNLISYLKKD